jgi:uncharacterized protein (DUF433 family)
MSLAMASAAKIVYAHIVKEPGYCGGKAAIGATRVRVNNVVFLHKHGKAVDEIRETYADLSVAQIHAALAYYYDHTSEIEAELQRDEDAQARFEAEKAEDLSHRQDR